MEHVRDVNVEEIMERTRDDLRRVRLFQDGEGGDAPHRPAGDGQVRADLEFLGSGYDVRDISMVSHRRVLGRVVVRVKDALRTLLTPILDRQVVYNAAVARVLARTQEQLAALEHRQGERGEASEGRFATVETQLLAREAQLRAREGELRSIRRQFDGLEEQVGLRETHLRIHASRLEMHATRLAGLESSVLALEAGLDRLRATVDALERLPSQLQEMGHAQARLQTGFLEAESRLQQGITGALDRTRGEMVDAVGDLEAAIAAIRSEVRQELEAHARARQASDAHEWAMRERPLRERIAGVERAIRRVIHASADPGRLPHATEPPANIPTGGAGFDYARFEERFRGTEEEVTERQRAYVEHFRGREPVLDLGPGRGEFLEVLRAAGIRARGVDANLDMVLLCRERGLDVTAGDVFEHLTGLPDDSLGGIFAAQLIEHFPTERVIALVQLCHRKLAPGGMLALETPNPRCLMVFADSFYKDPSHVRPIHPDMMEFLLEATGFQDVELKFSAPCNRGTRIPPLRLPDVDLEPFNSGIERLNELLYGFQDYAVVGRKGA